MRIFTLHIPIMCYDYSTPITSSGFYMTSEDSNSTPHAFVWQIFTYWAIHSVNIWQFPGSFVHNPHVVSIFIFLMTNNV